MRKGLLMALALAAVMVIGGAASAAPSFYLSDLGGAILDGETIIVDPLTPFTLSVNYTTDQAGRTINVLLGYATATRVGTAAVPSPNPPLVSPTLSNFNAGLAGVTATSLGGGRHLTSTGPVRPYGINQGVYWGGDVIKTNQQLFDVTFASSLAAGQSVVLTFWDASTSGLNITAANASWTSAVVKADSSAAYVPGHNYSITVQGRQEVIPEPSSLLALTAGAMGLAGFAIRRRR